MLKLYDIVRLKKERPDIGIFKNYMGTIIDIIEDEKAYTVEFFDENNETIEESIYEYFTENDLIPAETYSIAKPINIELASGE